jgi:hypothetical protein
MSRVLGEYHVPYNVRSICAHRQWIKEAEDWWLTSLNYFKQPALRHTIKFTKLWRSFSVIASGAWHRQGSALPGEACWQVG